MSETLKPFNGQTFGGISPEVFSATRFLETISCQLADATQYLNDLGTMRNSIFNQTEYLAMTEAARVLNRRCAMLKETLNNLNFL